MKSCGFLSRIRSLLSMTVCRVYTYIHIDYITPFTATLTFMYTLTGHTIMWTHYLFYVHVTGFISYCMSRDTQCDNHTLFAW